MKLNHKQPYTSNLIQILPGLLDVEQFLPITKSVKKLVN